MTNGQIKKELLCMAEEDYQKFASSLIPGVRGVLGVRLPALRKLAKRIAKEDWCTYLENAADDSFEEIMLQGFVIGSAPMEFSRRLKYIAAFLPKIDNWSVCDSFCTSLKATKEHRKEMWEFILPRMSCGREYEIRFAVVMMLNYYISEDYLNEALSLLVSVSHDGYYVKMGVAWALSMYYVCFPQQVLPVLTQGLLNDFTHNKTIQKIIESRIPPRETKDMLRGMKRK